MYLRTEVHLNRCKAAVDEDKGRRRREDSMVEIRKNKRKENLQKKRLEAVAGGANQFPLQTNLQSASANEKKLENLCAMVEGVWSDNKDLQLEATTQFRMLLSIERSPPIDEVIQSGVVPRFVYFLGRDNFPQLQLEAARALTNIASGTSDHTRVVIKHKAVPIFVKLLASPSDDVREHAVWALGNVAGDSAECRDFVLEQGALIPLLDLINEHTKLSIMRKATWTLFNLCRGKPRPSFDRTRPALPALRQLIHSKDEQVLTHACWALSYLSDGTNDKIRAVIKSNVCPRLVELLNHSSHSVRYPALRTVGNIAAGDNMQTQYIIDHQALPCLFNMLSNDQQKSIKKEACWTISNITAGNEEQIQDVIDAKIVGPLVCLLQNAEIDIKKEAACAISNAIYGGSHDQIKYLVDQGCIKPLCDLLICPDRRIVTVCLDGLENILKFGEVDKILGESGYVNQYAQKIDEGWTKIKNLHNKGYKKATKLLETYYKEEVQKPVEEEKKVEEEAKPAAGDEKKAEESKDPPPPPPPQEVVLRVFMHCEGCARKVRRCLKGFDGVEDVVTDCKTHKVVVKGEKADPMKVMERVQKKSHRKVELLSPVPKPPEEEPKKPEQEEPPKPEEKKDEPPVVITVVLKVHMHCEACAQEIRKRILKMKGVESAIPDLKSSQVTVKGTFATTDLLDYVHKKTGKTAVIVKQDPEPKAEDDKSAKDDKKDGDGEKKEEKKADEGDKPADSAAKLDDAMESAVLDMRKNEYYYYQPANFQLYPPRHAAESAYAYAPAPQMFSDENPNACSVM